MKFLTICLLSFYLTSCITEGGVKEKPIEEQVDAYVQLGTGYYQGGDYELAKGPLAKALELDRNNPEANMVLALVFNKEGEVDLAKKHFQIAKSSSRNDAKVLNNYGTFLYQNGEYQNAMNVFKQASEDTLYTERSRVFENIGLTALKLNDIETAKANFSHALKLNQNQPTSLLEMANLLYREKNFDLADKYLTTYSVIGKANPKSALLGYFLYLSMNNREKAASYELQLRNLFSNSEEYKQYLQFQNN